MKSLPHQPNAVATHTEQVKCPDMGFSCIGTSFACNIMISCDSQAAIPKIIASIVVVVIAMYEESSLVWTSKVFSYQLPV